MRYSLLFFGLLIPFLVDAQTTNFQDNFTDKDISDWTGTNNDFTFVTETGNVLLQQDATTAGSSHLSIPSTNSVGFWEFFVRLDFSPSDGNKAEFYLMSDSANFDQALNGYMLQAGEDGSADVFRLFKITGGVKDGEILTGTTSIASGGDFRVKILRDASGNWGLEVANSYSASTIQEATGTDNSYTSTTFFGFKTTYTSTRSDKFSFDFKIDIPPIQIISASIQDANTINIQFSKDYDPASIQNLDFTLNPGGINPTTINQTSSSSVELVFAEDLPSGSLNLGIASIEDSNNQTMLADTSITLFKFDDYQPGDIVINEFLKDPPESLEEYIELQNTSSKLLNLKDWELGDNGSLSILSNQDVAILPDSFLVITSDTAALKSVFGDIAALEVSLPAFNNSTDQIRLYDKNRVTIDSLEYTPEWGGIDVAVERRSSAAPSIYIENWGDSPNLLSGTPGRENEVNVDSEPPKIQSAFILSSTSIQINFNETIDKSNAENLFNVSVTPSNPSLSMVSSDGNQLVLTFDDNFIDGVTYDIEISNQEDIFGNTSPLLITSLKYLVFSSPASKDIIINEILYKKVDENSPEFIELYNPSSNNFDLSNWSISDAATNSATLPEGTFLESNSFIVLTDKQHFANSIANRLYLSGFPSLNDNGDGIILKTDSGITIDSLFYTELFGGNEDGISAEKKDPNGASNDANNWISNSSQSGNSAGIENTVFEFDVIAPEVIFANLKNNGNLFIAFSEFIDPSGVTFTANGQVRTHLVFDENNANQIVVDGTNLQTENPLELTVTNLSDVVGNILNTASIQISQPITKSSVVINEILYDPLSDNEDNLPDQTEYIELYNTKDYAISLESIFLHDAQNEDNEVNRLNPISSSFKWIQPKGYFLMYAEDQTSIFQESILAEYFGLESEPDQFTMQVDRSSLGLSASGDAIFISDSSGTTIDSVFYDESWQNPNRIGTDGVALEKINPLGPSNDESNWSSSTDVSGGTPGVQNSIYQETGSAPTNSGISFSPNPFSPDDDGFEDFLSINYTLDEADYLLRVRIYDRYGREVRELVDGKPAGFSGNLIWDGLTDDGNKNRVGIYIVLFKAYNSANGKDRTFKKTVVIARKF